MAERAKSLALTLLVQTALLSVLLQMPIPWSRSATQTSLRTFNVTAPAASEPQVERPSPPRPLIDTEKLGAEPAPRIAPPKTVIADVRVAEAVSLGIATAPTAASPRAAAAMPAPSGVAARSEASAVPAPARAAPSAYASRVSAWIEQRKAFPRDLARELREGVVVVRFALDPRGRVIDSAVLRPSGTPWLDRLALSQIRKASPFPRPPAGLSDEARIFEVPMRYRAA